MSADSRVARELAKVLNEIHILEEKKRRESATKKEASKVG